MMSGNFFRDKAAECEELARCAEDWECRKAFRDLARKWETLAASWTAQDWALGPDGA